MTTAAPTSQAASTRTVAMVCIAAMASLAVAMGVGRFAFTPLFPFMVRDGSLTSEAGAVLAASNYLGYLVGAMSAGKIRAKASTLFALGLLGTVVVTAAVGWMSSVTAWTLLRFAAGALSAWTLVATSQWGLAWLTSFGKPQLAGIIFAGVGLGIAGAGLFCIVAARPGVSAQTMWIELALLSAVAAVLPLAASRLFADPGARRQEATAQQVAASPAASTTGLVVCYGLFGFGYILPATYLPALARQLVDDPQVFGLAWPLFGAAAALSTVVASLWLKKANRLTIWAASHVLMAIGVLLPSMWRSLVSIAIAALLVGGTFMVITMIAMQEARARDERNATVILARMTAGFAFGQLLGPVVSAVLTRWTADATSALHLALALSAGGLILSAGYLWRELRKQTAFNGNKP